jgi:hypothetical protein
LLSTKEGDTVLDCFAGTSTTGLFALAYKRKFIGFELNPEFIKASEINLKDLQFYWRNPEFEKLSHSGKYYESGTNRMDPNMMSKYFLTYYNSPQKTSPELSKSYKNFTRSFNECFRTIRKIK